MGTLPIFVLVTLAVLFGLFVMVLTVFLGPKKPSPEKLAPYECGIQEIEAPKRRFPIKYLLTGMLFIVFDIEIVSFSWCDWHLRVWSAHFHIGGR